MNIRARKVWKIMPNRSTSRDHVPSCSAQVRGCVIFTVYQSLPHRGIIFRDVA